MINLKKIISRLPFTDTAYVARGSFWLLVGQASASGFTLILAVVLANLLSKDVYGAYQYIVAVSSILLIASLTGMRTAIVQATASGKEGIARGVMSLQMKWGILSGIGSLILSGWYLSHGDQRLGLSFAAAALFLPFFDALGAYGGVLVGRKDFKRSTKYEVITQVVFVVSLIAAALDGRVFVLILAYFLPRTVMRAIFSRIVLTKRISKSNVIAKVVSDGKHVSIIGALGTFAAHLDKLLIWYFLGSEAVAVYYLALAPVNQMKGLASHVYTLALPKFSKRTVREMDTLFVRRVLFVFFIGFVFAAAYALVARPLYGLFFPSYSEAVKYTQALAFLVALRLPLLFLNASVFSKLPDVSKRFLHLMNIPSIILVGSLAVLVPVLGIWGAVAANYIYGFVGLLTALVIWRSIKRGSNNSHDPALVRTVNLAYHEEEVATYERSHDEIFVDERERWERIATYIARLREEKGRPLSILDIGAGTGFVASCLAPSLTADDKMVLIDISSAMLQKARENLAGTAAELSFEVSAVEEFDPGDIRFDAIVMNSVLHHVPDTGRLLERIDGWLATGGLLVVAHEPNIRHFSHPIVGSLDRLFRSLRTFRYRSMKGENQMISAVNRRLIGDGIISVPMSVTEIESIVDIHSPTAGRRIRTERGFDPRDLGNGVRDYSILSIETYRHLGKLGPNALDKLGPLPGLLASGFPDAGALFTVILKKP